jgi:hypothetical protein
VGRDQQNIQHVFLTKRSKIKENVNKTLKLNSLFLGAAIFAFGFLKFFEPFNAWFHIQIAKSGLPPFSIPLGIAGEISIGLTFLFAAAFSARIGSFVRPLLRLASAGLIVTMAVAIYVHLQPTVPARVLPLGIKPPVIPLFFMLLAIVNLVALSRAVQGARTHPASADGRAI